MTEELETTEKLDNQVDNKPERNEKGQLLPGNTANLKGRPKGQSLKEYDRDRFAKMSPEDKEEFLKGLSPEMRYKMAEGNPHQSSDVGVSGKLIVEISKEIADKHNVSDQSTGTDSEGQA